MAPEVGKNLLGILDFAANYVGKLADQDLFQSSAQDYMIISNRTLINRLAPLPCKRPRES